MKDTRFAHNCIDLHSQNVILLELQKKKRHDPLGCVFFSCLKPDMVLYFFFPCQAFSFNFSLKDGDDCGRKEADGKTAKVL